MHTEPDEQDEQRLRTLLDSERELAAIHHRGRPVRVAATVFLIVAVCFAVAMFVVQDVPLFVTLLVVLVGLVTVWGIGTLHGFNAARSVMHAARAAELEHELRGEGDSRV